MNLAPSLNPQMPTEQLTQIHTGYSNTTALQRRDHERPLFPPNLITTADHNRRLGVSLMSFSEQKSITGTAAAPLPSLDFELAQRGRDHSWSATQDPRSLRKAANSPPRSRPQPHQPHAQLPPSFEQGSRQHLPQSGLSFSHERGATPQWQPQAFPEPQQLQPRIQECGVPAALVLQQLQRQPYNTCTISLNPLCSTSPPTNPGPSLGTYKIAPVFDVSSHTAGLQSRITSTGVIRGPCTDPYGLVAASTAARSVSLIQSATLYEIPASGKATGILCGDAPPPPPPPPPPLPPPPPPLPLPPLEPCPLLQQRTHAAPDSIQHVCSASNSIPWNMLATTTQGTGVAEAETVAGTGGDAQSCPQDVMQGGRTHQQVCDEYFYPCDYRWWRTI